MNKYFILATAAFALAACSSEEENMQAEKSEIRLCSNMDVVQSRAALQDLQLTQFASNQKVDIFINENTTGSASVTYDQPLTYTTGTDGSLTISDAQYFPQNGNGIDIYAVYPTGIATDVTGTAVAFSVKDDQSTDANYMASDLMVGAPASNPVSRTTSAVPLTFKHCLTKINLNLYPGDGLTADDLANAVVKINGTIVGATFNVKSGAVTVNNGGTAATPTTSISLGNMATDATGVLVASAIIIPQTVNAGTQFISIDLIEDGQTAGTLAYSLPAAVNFDAATAYTYNITAKRSGLTVSSSNIANWTNGGAVNGDATP
jgi:hypothetical protein